MFIYLERSFLILGIDLSIDSKHLGLPVGCKVFQFGASEVDWLDVSHLGSKKDVRGRGGMRCPNIQPAVIIIIIIMFVLSYAI